MAACTRTTWRGVIVCAHTVPLLNNWAKAVGDSILLKPLAGCGSYQTTTTASAGTHAGGGAIDIDLRAVPSDKRKWVADRGRVSGLQVAWHRNYVSGLWTWHAHALDPACPNLAKAAVSQIVEFKNGGDGLVGTAPDGNTRVNVNQLVAIFTARLITVVSDITADAKTRQLQQAVRQTVDGVWGEQTDIDLRNSLAEGIDGYTGRNFKLWSEAERKRRQKAWGVPQTGVWDAATKKGAWDTARGIQQILGVPVDGIIGDQTKAAYFALRRKKYTGQFGETFPIKASPAPAPAPKPVDFSLPFYRTGPANFFPYPGKQGASYYGPNTAGKPWYSGRVAGGPNDATWVSGEITLSAIKSRIKKIQKFLKITQDGIYGAETVAAVKKWQAAHGLSADGIVGPGTWQAMAKSINN